MKPERILHMIGSFEVGGSQMMVINLYRAIDRSKIQFDFIVDHPDRMELAESVEKLGARIYYMPTFVGSNIQQVYKAWDTFFQKHPDYKVLHSHVRSYASLYLPIAKKYGVKTIVHSHNTSNGKGVKAFVKAAMQYPLRYQADYFFSCSQEAGRWLFGKKIAEGDRHHILKNAIDVAAYRYDVETRRNYRHQLGLGSEYVFVHIGRFTPQKNHAFLLRVFWRIQKENPNTKLMLLGDGELRPEIEKQIDQLEIRNSVMMLGNRSDIPKILQAADCMLFPSRWEGLGIVALEGQAAGLSCICSDQVPRVAQVTDSCCFLPLDEEIWTKKALSQTQKSQVHRRDAYDAVVKHGYDINHTAKWLENFYLRAADPQV